MCGRFALLIPGEELAEAFNLPSAPVEMAPRYNIAPTQPVACRLSPVAWSLPPLASRATPPAAKRGG